MGARDDGGRIVTAVLTMFALSAVGSSEQPSWTNSVVGLVVAIILAFAVAPDRTLVRVEGAAGLTSYRPEPVLVRAFDGDFIPALGSTLRQAPGEEEGTADYARKLPEAMVRAGLPGPIPELALSPGQRPTPRHRRAEWRMTKTRSGWSSPVWLQVVGPFRDHHHVSS